MGGEEPSDSITDSLTITADFIDRVLSAYGSPAAGTGQAMYGDGVATGIDPVYALAFFLHEDSFGKTGIGAANHSFNASIWNLRNHYQKPCLKSDAEPE